MLNPKPYIRPILHPEPSLGGWGSFEFGALLTRGLPGCWGGVFSGISGGFKGLGFRV